MIHFTKGQAVHFDHWIKLFDNVVAMSNWNNSDIFSMLSTKMTGEAYDFLQNILGSDTRDYTKIKALFQEISTVIKMPTCTETNLTKFKVVMAA